MFKSILILQCFLEKKNFIYKGHSLKQNMVDNISSIYNINEIRTKIHDFR